MHTDGIDVMRSRLRYILFEKVATGVSQLPVVFSRDGCSSVYVQFWKVHIVDVGANANVFELSLHSMTNTSGCPPSQELWQMKDYRDPLLKM